jgi:hypothetical protein
MHFTRRIALFAYTSENHATNDAFDRRILHHHPFWPQLVRPDREKGDDEFAYQ